MCLYKRQWHWHGNSLHLGPGTAVCGCDLQAESLTDHMHIYECGINLIPWQYLDFFSKSWTYQGIFSMLKSANPNSENLWILNFFYSLYFFYVMFYIIKKSEPPVSHLQRPGTRGVVSTGPLARGHLIWPPGHLLLDSTGPDWPPTFKA